MNIGPLQGQQLPDLAYCPHAYCVEQMGTGPVGSLGEKVCKMEGTEAKMESRVATRGRSQ